jgi:hypothetical protein
LNVPARLLYLIAISSCIRLVVGYVLELSNDEVYYYLYALDIQPNYFDHPPGVGLLIRVFTGDLRFTQEIFVRLGAIACAGIGTYFSYRIGRLLKNETTAWLSALLYSTSIYTSVIAGTFIIPDSPQVVFWLGALWVMFSIMVAADQQQRVLLAQWISFGLLSGLAIMCKVHGIFLWFGMGLYVLFFRLKLLTRYGLYLSMLVTLAVISPIVWWNVKNDFITYRFHSERVAVAESMIHLDYFVQTLAGQVLYNNPLNVVIIIIGLIKWRSMKLLDVTASTFILINGVPIILVVSGMALFNPMLPHWSGPGFMVMMFIAAAYLEEKLTKGVVVPHVLKASIFLVVASLISATLLITKYPGTIGSQNREELGDGDFTLDMFGWKQLGRDFKPWLEDQKRNGVLSQNIKVVSHKWFPAAHLEHYVTSPIGVPMIGVGDVTDLHQYFWLNKSRPLLHKGDTALCIIPSNSLANMQESYLKYFATLEKLHVFENTRGGKVARYFYVFRLDNYQMDDEAHLK